MSANQEHHYLPQCYQRGWTGGDGKLFVYKWVRSRIECKRRSPKSTAWTPGLYFAPGLPPNLKNVLEDEVWRRIDQWLSDGLEVLRSNDVNDIEKIDKSCWSVVITAMIFRNPSMIKYINDQANRHILEMIKRCGFEKYRSSDEPDSQERFENFPIQDGMLNISVQSILRIIINSGIYQQIYSMKWGVVNIDLDFCSIITSDNPVTIYSGLKQDDGFLVFPINKDRFFIAFNDNHNKSESSMMKLFTSNNFVRIINKRVIEQKYCYVYAFDDSMTDFINNNFKE
ncbi:DUF4238 domain-containing protein [Azospirillum griseum]|uniref:DUF4238 domain-containing protein n=1 Tax=Azospirillum griseum TaxID=2496639 RepID=A0A3S0K6Z2_9PROT|nr:DUF4238 domain-containing protein [Azospirillum griseum]RTR22898.1 DUF4238 domain-containing protein [Azospirillum griseum]